MIYMARNEDRCVTVREIARDLGQSRFHLMKIANVLSREGMLSTLRGRAGGLRLARSATTISIGDIIRATEVNLPGSRENLNCQLVKGVQCECAVPSIIGAATAAFLHETDRFCLADVARGQQVNGTCCRPLPLPI